MDNKKKKEVLEKARELGDIYLDKYGGCAQATFSAVSEATGLDHSEDIFKSLVGLSGGGGCLGTGSCGAFIGGAAGISLSMNIGRDDLERDTDKKWKIYRRIVRFGKKFQAKYRDITCRKVQMELFGLSFDLLDEESYKKFEEISNCEEVVADAAEWAAEIILQSRSED